MSQESGKRINKAISGSDLDSSLKRYNDSLYQFFQELKPRFVKLDNIDTWREMDKNTTVIKEMFEKFHPIMFFQILSFNPSTVLESKKLSKLKQEALLKIINNAEKESFYSSYRLAYLNELLIDRNYTVRFLDEIMNKKEKQEFIRQLEDKKG